MTEVWAVPAFLEYVQPSLTPVAVAAAEAQLGVRLPAAYLELLAVQNGGHLRGTWPGLPHTRLNGIGPNWPSLTTDRPWWLDPEAVDEMWIPEQPELLVPFDSDGHWDLCFDYRTGGPEPEPAIAFVDNDAERDVPVAGSFAEFRDGWVDELARTAIRIYAEVGLDEFGARLAAAAGRPLVDQGDWNEGFRQLYLRLAEDGRALWVSENRVPAGFRRDGRAVVLTHETALRLPDDPACRLIVTCTPDAVDEARALTAA